MNDNDVIYERHDGLGIIQNQKVAVIGCGGIGSWISLYLGLAGVRAIDIYDSDIISENNLNRFPLGPDKVGVNKAVAMAEHIQSLRQGVTVIPRQNFDPSLHAIKLGGYSWVIVTTDSLKSRRMVYEEVVKAGKDSGRWIGYIEAGADGHHATVTFSPATMATAEEENPGYRSVPVWVGPCAMAATIASYYVLHGDVRDYERTHRVDWGTNGTESPLVCNERLLITDINEADEEIEVEEIDESASDVADTMEYVESLPDAPREVDSEQAI
jgi:hypothetical protein